MSSTIPLTGVDADRAIGVPPKGSRYVYDLCLGSSQHGEWEQYDTDQDDWCFGVWVNVQQRKVFTYAEGDRLFQACETAEEFLALLQEMATWYGKAPPGMIGFDHSGKTLYYTPRPGDSLLGLSAQSTLSA